MPTRKGSDAAHQSNEGYSAKQGFLALPIASLNGLRGRFLISEATVFTSRAVGLTTDLNPMMHNQQPPTGFCQASGKGG